MVFWEDDNPVGILPGTIEDRIVKFIGDERVTDLADIMYFPDREEDIIMTLAAKVASEEWHIDLFPLEVNSPIVQHLPNYITDARIEESELSPLLMLPDSWDGYLKNLNGKQRHELRRKMKKIDGVTVREMEPHQIDILFRLMAASSKKKKEFLSEEMRTFFTKIVNSFSQKGWLRFHVTFVDASPLGALLSFRFGDCIYLYNMGFDTDFQHLSPGIILIALDIKSAIKEEVRYYDFLRGAERYKFDLGAERRYTKRVRK